MSSRLSDITPAQPSLSGFDSIKSSLRGFKYILLIAILGFCALVFGIAHSSDNDTSRDYPESLFEHRNPYGETSQYKSVYDDYSQLSDKYRNLSIDYLVRKTDTCIRNNNIEEGMMYLRVAISRDYESLDDNGKCTMALAYSNLGYLWLSEYQNPMQAYPLLIRGVEITRDLWPHEDVQKIAPALFDNMAKMYMVFDDIPRAMTFYRKSFDISIRTQFNEAVINSFVNLTHCAWLSDSLASIDSERAKFRNYKDSYLWLTDYAKTLERAAQRYRDKDYAGSLALLDSALKSLDVEIFEQRYVSMNRLIAASTALKGNDMKGAARSLAMADSMIMRYKINDMTDNLYRLEAEYARRQGDDKAATAKMLSALASQDSLFSLQKYGMVLDLQSAWEAAGHDRRLAVAEAETARHRTTIFFLIILAVTVVVASIWIFMKNLKLKESNRELFRKNIELMNMESGAHEAPIPVPAPSDPISLDEGEGREMDETGSPVNPIDTIIPDNYDSSTAPSNLRAVYDKVRGYMTTSDDVYDAEFTIDNVSASTGIRAKLISQAIKSVTGKNFSVYLAEIRIREACRILLATSGPARPTIETIAERIGYHSRSHFSRVFKSVTGLTTTEFITEASYGAAVSNRRTP